MADDLIKIIERQKGLTNVVLLTFNIDLMFIESILTKSLRKCGHPRLTIFADAEEASRTFAGQAPWLTGIGRRFRVVPVQMRNGSRFHAKLVLLSGEENAELLVGSGNATFGGYRQNAEIWTSFTSSDDGIGPFAAANRLLVTCVSQAGDPLGARQDIAEAFDPATHAWFASDAEPSDLVWRLGQGTPLFTQMASVLGDQDFERIVVCSPYYDDYGAALGEFHRRWPEAHVELLVQEKGTELTKDILERSGVYANLVSVVAPSPNEAERFVHAKFYAFVSGEEVTLFTGSANCSVAALVSGRRAGNAECLAVRRMPLAEFEDDVLADLVFNENPPALAETQVTEEVDPASEGIRVASASYTYGELSVRFAAPPDTRIETCLVDGEGYPLSDVLLHDDGFALTVSRLPAVVALEGIRGEERIVSRPHWVDHETMLSTTSRQRQLGDAVAGKVSPEAWSLGSWAELLRALGDHLRYNPEQMPVARRASNQDERRCTYTEADFFATDYRLPAVRRTEHSADQAFRIDSLRKLLLNYLGITSELAASEDSHQTAQDDGGDRVDRPETAPAKGADNAQKNRKPARQSPSEAERRRAQKIAFSVVEQLVNEEFLRNRPSRLLATDLTVAAILLVAGRCENWLEDADFFALSQKVWARLFLCNGSDDSDIGNLGWLDALSTKAENREQFHQDLCKPQLTAALALWVFTCPDGKDQVQSLRFKLATRLAVARTPWLWNLQHRDVAEEIHRIASNTGWFAGERTWTHIADSWERLYTEGRAMHRLEAALNKHTSAYWRELVQEDMVEEGELLWQSTLGFAVPKCRADRKAKQGSTRVLLLTSDGGERTIRSTFLLPVRSLAGLLASRKEYNFSKDDVGALKSSALLDGLV